MSSRLAAHQLAAARLRQALSAGGLDRLPDSDLLDRFARYGEHPAFEVLLRRHGPMVFGVCRRILTGPADVDDAFQAAFLVFIRKARTIRRGDRLGPWLYGVAVRVALKARSRAARQAARHCEATDMIAEPNEPAQLPDWLPILDAELSALPAKYREPLVLCELQGATRADAAQTLGIPEGTLSSRLARGRELLRKRLLKHGTLLPAGGIATLFTASGVGRATVPAALLAKTSEVAVISATGTVAAGAVSAGAARLTDEVLKGMFITKLRMAGAAIVALGLAAVGLAATWPNEPIAQLEKPKASPPVAKAGESKTQPPKKAEPGAALKGADDREAIQGLWVVEKLDAGKGNQDESREIARAMVGKMQFLFNGDMCWNVIVGPGGQAAPLKVKLDSSKNPKWLDLIELGGGNAGRCIYEIDGDRLTIASGGKPEVRPAEFTTDDDATSLIVFHFRREKLPPPVGDPALVGSWASDPVTAPHDKSGQAKILSGRRIEIINGFLFAWSGDDSGKWLSARCTVDTTKNPKWIDLELIAAHDEKTTKLYGCYEVVDGRLKMALGLDGKRVTRPLELKQENDMLFFDVKATQEPIIGIERVPVDDASHRKLPNPQPRGAAVPDTKVRPKAETKPLPNPLPALPDPLPSELKPKADLQPLPNPTPIRPDPLPTPSKPKVESKSQANPTTALPAIPPTELKPKVESKPQANLTPALPDIPPVELKPKIEDKLPPVAGPTAKTQPRVAEDIQQFMQTRDFVKAEKSFRKNVAEQAGLSRAIYQLWLGICLLERARTTIQSDADRAKLHDEARDLFRKVIAWADDSQTPGTGTRGTVAEFRTMAELYALQVLQEQWKADEVIAATEELWVRHRGTVEELFVLSIAYHAYKQNKQMDKAEGVRHTMKELFDKLKDKPDAFRAETGEWSRAYWERVWFAEE